MGKIVKKGIEYSGSATDPKHVIVEITQEEYDKLGEYKNNDNITYFIIDGYSSLDEVLKNNIANNYSPTKTYNVGDLCFKNNILYMCTSDIETPEAWVVSHWNRTTVGEILSILYKTIRS